MTSDKPPQIANIEIGSDPGPLSSPLFAKIAINRSPTPTPNTTTPSFNQGNGVSVRSFIGGIPFSIISTRSLCLALCEKYQVRNPKSSCNVNTTAKMTDFSIT